MQFQIKTNFFPNQSECNASVSGKRKTILTLTYSVRVMRYESYDIGDLVFFLKRTQCANVNAQLQSI